MVPAGPKEEPPHLLPIRRRARCVRRAVSTREVNGILRMVELTSPSITHTHTHTPHTHTPHTHTPQRRTRAHTHTPHTHTHTHTHTLHIGQVMTCVFFHKSMATASPMLDTTDIASEKKFLGTASLGASTKRLAHGRCIQCEQGADLLALFQSLARGSGPLTLPSHPPLPLTHSRTIKVTT